MLTLNLFVVALMSITLVVVGSPQSLGIPIAKESLHDVDKKVKTMHPMVQDSIEWQDTGQTDPETNLKMTNSKEESFEYLGNAEITHVNISGAPQPTDSNWYYQFFTASCGAGGNSFYVRADTCESIENPWIYITPSYTISGFHMRPDFYGSLTSRVVSCDFFNQTCNDFLDYFPNSYPDTCLNLDSTISLYLSSIRVYSYFLREARVAYYNGYGCSGLVFTGNPICQPANWVYILNGFATSGTHISTGMNDISSQMHTYLCSSPDCLATNSTFSIATSFSGGCLDLINPDIDLFINNIGINSFRIHWV